MFRRLLEIFGLPAACLVMAATVMMWLHGSGAAQPMPNNVVTAQILRNPLRVPCWSGTPPT
jgi:hypothetical protein